MSFAADTILELCARLRLMARAAGIDPWDVRLDDLAPDVRRELMAEADRDFWRLMCASPTTTTTGPTDAEAEEYHPTDQPAEPRSGNAGHD